jgi:hypothetical protein
MYRSTRKFSLPQHKLELTGQFHAPATLSLGKEVPIGEEEWVGPRAGLDDMEKLKFLTLPGLELRPFRRPVRDCRYRSKISKL